MTDQDEMDGGWIKDAPDENRAYYIRWFKNRGLDPKKHGITKLNLKQMAALAGHITRLTLEAARKKAA